MLKTHKILELKILLATLETELGCSSQVKVYPASWLEKKGTVVRDAYGRFASKGSEVATDIKNKTEKAGKIIQEIRDNPEDFQRKINTKLLIAADKNLQKMVKANPELANNLTNLIFGKTAQETRDSLADLYEMYNPKLPNAIKPDPFKEFVADLKREDKEELIKDLRRGVELAGYNYNQLLDDLNNTESDSEIVKILGKLAATSIPIAGYLAVTLAPEVAIGLLFEETVGTVLTSAAITQSASFAANKALDKQEIENPVVRLGVDLAIAIAANPTTEALNLGKKGINQLAKTTISDDLKKAGEAYIALAKGNTKEALRIHSDGVVTCFASMILDAPINRLLLFKQTYRNGIKKSAKEAKKMAQDFIDKVPENLDYKRAGVVHKAEHITIVSGGFAGREGKSSTHWVRTMREQDELFNNHHLVKFNNAKFDLSKEAVGRAGNEIVFAINGNPILPMGGRETLKLTLGNVFKKGYNPAAIEMAAQAYAYTQKHPGMPINLVAHSGGGMISNEAAAILKELKVETKVVNLGSPTWGLLPKNKNAITLTSDLDGIVQGLPLENAVTVNSVEDHAHYLIDTPARKQIKAFLENKPVEEILLKEEIPPQPIFSTSLDDWS